MSLCMHQKITYTDMICADRVAFVKKKNQCEAIRRDFEATGLTLLNNPLDVGWSLVPTLPL